jgi:chromosome segregation ATPase
MTQMADARTDKLIAARRQVSRDKRAHALQTLLRLAESAARISFARLAREAGVSTWLLYNSPELKQAVTDAMRRQSRPEHQPPHTASEKAASPHTASEKAASPQSLRTDLELARHEIAALRRSEQRLRERLQRTLGAEIEQIDRSELIARIAELEKHLDKLHAENTELTETNTKLTHLIAQQSDDLDTANTLLRRYMKEASRVQTASTD